MSSKPITAEQRETIYKYLAEGKLSNGAIAKIARCSRGTVRNIFHGLLANKTKPKIKPKTEIAEAKAKKEETRIRQQIEMRKKQFVEVNLDVEQRKRNILFQGWWDENGEWRLPRFLDEAEAGREGVETNADT